MWVQKNNNLYRKYIFHDFQEAWVFMGKIAALAEQHNHHPTIINTYNTVELFLSTHDSGNNVTEKDQMLSREIDSISLK